MTYAVFHMHIGKRVTERQVGEAFPTFEAAQGWLQRNVAQEARNAYAVRQVAA